MKRLVILFILIGISTGAQTRPDDVDTTYFHPAASRFIHGDSSGASNLVAQGLSIFPEDGKLLRLKELLDQQQEQQQDQNDQQQQQQDQNQDQQQDEQQQDQDNESEQEDQQQDEQNQDQNQNQEDDRQPEPARAEQMSQDEAERLLDAMKQEEETKRLQLHPVLGRPIKVEKDW